MQQQAKQPPIDVYQGGTHEYVVQMYIAGAGNLSVDNLRPAPGTEKPEVLIYFDGPLDMLTVLDGAGNSHKLQGCE